MYTYTDIRANAMTDDISKAGRTCCSELAGTKIKELCISELVAVNARRLGTVGGVLATKPVACNVGKEVS